jgi:hypothetical protein
VFDISTFLAYLRSLLWFSVYLRSMNLHSRYLCSMNHRRTYISQKSVIRDEVLASARSRGVRGAASGILAPSMSCRNRRVASSSKFRAFHVSASTSPNLESISRNRFGRNLRIKPKFVKFRVAIMTLNYLKITKIFFHKIDHMNLKMLLYVVEICLKF